MTLALHTFGFAMIILRMAMPGRWDKLLQVLILVTYTFLAGYHFGEQS